MARGVKGGNLLFEAIISNISVKRGLFFEGRLLFDLYCYVQCYKNAWYCPFPFRMLFFSPLLTSAELICFSPYILARV